MNIEQTICFTGHRPDRLGGYVPSPTQTWVKKALKTAIQNSLNEKIKYFISGGALGVDQWAVKIVLDLKKTDKAGQSSHCKTVPFPGKSMEERGKG